MWYAITFTVGIILGSLAVLWCVREALNETFRR